MTADDPALHPPDPSARLAGMIKPLALLAVMTVVTAAILFVSSLPFAARALAIPRPPGLGLTIGALLLAAFGLVACLGMVLARRRGHTPQATKMAAQRAAGWPQSLLSLLFAAGAAGVVLADWPAHQATASLSPGPAGFATASALLLLALPWLLAERYVASVPRQRLPESEDLRNLLFLPVFFLGAQAAMLIAAALGFPGTIHWVQAALSTVMLLMCIELSLRTMATWFLPPPSSAAARAIIGSTIAGALRGKSLSPSVMAGSIRSQFGMDFSRSWALHFVRVTAVPVTLLMLVFCWFLTGVTRVDLNQRGAYERFGTVGTILRPGLHLVLPWPFGSVRHVEFGVLHSALIGLGEQGGAPEVADHATAEGDAPATANRLWDSEQPTDVSYIIASSEQGRQSFQTVSASVRIVYRIGLDDASAEAALYHEDDPDLLVRSLAGRMLAQYFSTRTLPSLLGENQAVIAQDVRAHLRQALDQLQSGIDIVAVTIEAIHPPAGAASAYRNVQAAEIEATTSIAAERGRAETTLSLARRDAHSAVNDAKASAADTVSAAKVDLTDITADDRPYRAAAQPFLLERYFSDVKSALASVPLEIVDHRLTAAALPTIDLRPPGMVQDGLERHPAQGERTGENTQ